MDETKQLIVHLPSSMKDDLQKVADREHRSLSGQVRLLLEEGLSRITDAHPPAAAKSDVRSGDSAVSALS